MKRTMMILLAILMLLSVCMTASAESGKRVAKDGAQMQTDDPTMPTRLPPENGTKILLHFGDTVIPGVLNDSETAQALIAKLPYIQHMSRYSHDFCGVTEDLPYNEEEEHYGWLNGDIDYATDAPYFTILFEDQDESEIYGSQVNIGVITCPLSDIAALNGLKELAANDLTIQMSMYGGFEQVGSIGQRLPSSDVQTSTSSGDIVLYSSNQLVVFYGSNSWAFYGSNSWAYTRLGHITDKTSDEMRMLLSNGDVTITLSMK